jgi:hypothetical protein
VSETRAAELELEAVYMHVVTCPRIAAAEATIPGVVTVNGIRNTERLWISYRAAWVALGRRLRPGGAWCVVTNDPPARMRWRERTID